MSQPRRTAEGLTAQLTLFTSVRVIVNTGFRMVYPFLPVIARGLGVPLETAAAVLTVRHGVGFAGPLFGSIADVRGRRFAIVLAGVLLVVGGVIAGVWTTVAGFTLGILLIAAGKMIYDPAVQAFVGDRVPYARRGRVLAVIELAWSLSFLLGMPAVGFLIARTAWHWPFIAFAVLMLLGTVLLARRIPHDVLTRNVQRPTWRNVFSRLFSNRVTVAALAFGMLITFANEIVNIVFGTWLEVGFGLAVTGLGVSAAIIGMAELGGEGLVATVSDRIGLKRAVAIGLAGNVIASLLLPALGFSRAAALVGLFLFYITFEYLLVSSIPLISEISPAARATTLAGFAASASLGRALGALLAPPVFQNWGILGSGITVALINVVALSLLLEFVHLDQDGGQITASPGEAA